MKTEEDIYKDLYSEMQTYERNGVSMVMDGYKVSPIQVVTAYMTKEEGTYMRDYVISPEGKIESLVFTNINDCGQAEITP